MTIEFASEEIILQCLMGKGASRAKAGHLKGSIGGLGKCSFLQHAGLVDNAAHNILYGNGIILVFQKAGHLSDNLSLAVFVLHGHALGFFIGRYLHYQLQAFF